MKIAVIGAGLAGLAAAWSLARPQQAPAREVTVYERQPKPGFTASSVTLDDAAPAVVRANARPRVDVPLRVFYPGYYPTLTRLYAALGVRSEPVSYAASFLDARGALYFRYRNLRLGDLSFAVLAPQDLLAPGAAALVADALRFHRHARKALASGGLQGVSVSEFARRAGCSDAFVEGLLLPAICTVCTCPTALARELPAPVAVDYLVRGLARQAVRRACGGADEVQARLLAGIPEVRCGQAIESVRRDDQGVWVRTQGGEAARFDHVVFATTAPHAARMLADASAAEAHALAGFSTTPVDVVTHRDAACMPALRRHWSPVVLRVDPAHEAPESTIWINAVQPALAGAPDVFQTVSPHRPPREDSVLGRARFERPVISARSQASLASLQALHEEPGRRVWFCGAWAQAGVPLLESAVRSALEVAARLGAAPLEDPVAPAAQAGRSARNNP